MYTNDALHYLFKVYTLLLHNPFIYFLYQSMSQIHTKNIYLRFFYSLLFTQRFANIDEY